MAIYSISYHRPGVGVAAHKLSAQSEPEARIRFLNLSWVAFTEITINSIALAADQPEEAKAAARQASGRMPTLRAEPEAIKPAPREARRRTEAAIRLQVAGVKQDDWQAECDRLTDEIGKLADEAQALIRKGRHEAASELRTKARALVDARASLIIQNRRRK
ncbi:hypothetical protein [Microcystis phage Mae-JY30]